MRRRLSILLGVLILTLTSPTFGGSTSDCNSTRFILYKGDQWRDQASDCMVGLAEKVAYMESEILNLREGGGLDPGLTPLFNVYALGDPSDE